MKSTKQFNGIEDQLTLKFKSYQPNPLFVEKLKNRLFDQEVVEVEPSVKMSRIFLFSAGVIGFLAAILWLINFIASFFQEEESEI